MKKVICINDKNQPSGAKVVEGKEYEVIDEYQNFFDQKVYLLNNIPNQGRTKWGLSWVGYDASRFKDTSNSEEQYRTVIEETNFIFN